ncbi:uncharacterized protein BDV14DRAFT_198235 [Aspergillus stella-maris]|uniref:uncharacterized protein n=1 Tax=Aspergillus stella-maris TaxID=1810926 RepID=UPI003CCDC2A7
MDSNQPRQLTLLPVERIRHILDSLRPDTASLSRISRTCHFLYDVALPLLHRDIAIGNHQESTYQRILEADPELETYVKSFNIHYRLTATISLYTHGSFPCFVDLVPTIAKFDSLEMLTIKGCGYHCSPKQYTVYQQTFHSLFANAGNEDILSNLQTRARIHSFKVHDELIWSFPLQNLKLYSCDRSSSALINMLAIPQALKSLTFKGMPLGSRLPLYLEVVRQPYVHGIEQQAESLHTLDIDFWSTSSYRGDPISLFKLTAL